MEHGVVIVPTLGHKLYLVLSVAAATVCFFINTIQIVALIYHELLRSARNVLLLNQAVGGLITTFTVIYPIKLIMHNHGYYNTPQIVNLGDDVISRHEVYGLNGTENSTGNVFSRKPFHNHTNTMYTSTTGGEDFFREFSACFSLASGLLLLSIFLCITNTTMLVLEQYISMMRLKQHGFVHSDTGIVWTCIAIAWMESLAFTLIPWIGWNNWRGYGWKPTAWSKYSRMTVHGDPPYCLIPDIWTPTFTVLILLLSILHTMIIMFLFVSLWQGIRRRTYAVNPEGTSEEMPVVASAADIGTSTPALPRATISSITTSAMDNPNHRAFGGHITSYGSTLPSVSGNTSLMESTETGYQSGTVDSATTSTGNNFRTSVNLCLATFVLMLVTHIPVLVYFLRYIDCEHYSSAPSECSIVSYPERIDAYAWTSLFLVINAVIAPLVYVFSDDQLAKPTIWVLKLYCCPCKFFNHDPITP